MNRLSWLSLLFCLTSFECFGNEFILEIEQKCTSNGDKISFECKNSDVKRVAIFEQNGQWYGKNPGNDEAWKLGLLKEDEYIIVLDNPVFYSGKSIIYFIKPTNRFYWTEFAYSEILGEQEGTIRYGRVLNVRN